jgi:hypothetical protein
MKRLGFFFRDDLTLISYTTTKIDVPKKMNRMPTEVPQMFDVETYRKGDIGKTKVETIYTKNPTISFE